MIVGMDIGSRSVKIAVLNAGEIELLSYDTSEFYRHFSKRNEGVLVIDLERLGFSEIDEIVVTGYGRDRVRFLGTIEIPEIQAHSMGVQEMLNISDFVLIDLGGQDTKVVNVKDGKVVDFLTSDRCAASTGRFLENMAHILGISVQDLGNFKQNPAKIDSTCAVFAETELLEKMSIGVPFEEICAGVNFSVVRRFSALVRKFLPAQNVVATGGVSLNKALVEFLGNEIGYEVIVPENSQFAGAIGCIRYFKHYYSENLLANRLRL